MTTLNKAAEILVECDYAKSLEDNTDTTSDSSYSVIMDRHWHHDQKVDPFSDTLEGRRQLEAIYEHLTGVNIRQQMIDITKTGLKG